MLLAAGGDVLQSLVIAPQGIPEGKTLQWYGNDEKYGLLAVEEKLMTLSAPTKPGSIIR